MARQMPSDLGAVQQNDTSPVESAPIHSTANCVRVTTRRKRVSCFDLLPYPGQPAARYSEAAVADLRESISVLGLLVPPLVWRESGGYVVLAGFRRVRSWQLLALEGKVSRYIEIDLCVDLTAREARRIVIAEESHREEEFPVAKAERIGIEWLAMAEELGREPTLAEMAAVLKPEKTAISDSLTIYRALQDPRLEPLVRGADGAGKSLLVKALRATDFSRRAAALEAFQNGGKSSMSKVLSPRSGRPHKAVTRHPQGGGYNLTVRFRPSMSAEERALARDALAALLRDIEELPAPQE